MDEPLCLIVDDESALRTYLSVLLHRKGIHCLEAENAVTALRILQKCGGEIDLLITDIQMPGDMDGVDLAYSVRNLFPSIPIIMISGTTEEAPRGFIFIRKPFRADAIIKAIEKTMIATAAGTG